MRTHSAFPSSTIAGWSWSRSPRTTGCSPLPFATPPGSRLRDDLAARAGFPAVRMVLSPPEEVQAAINQLFDRSGEDTDQMVEDLESAGEDEGFRDLDELEDLMEATHEAPVIRVVNGILTQALRKGASDIHIEPYERDIAVRFRIDGILHEILTLTKRFHAHIVSRIKVMADLDIAEKRVPQDGRMKVRVASRTVDIRVSIIPMTHGERIVLRLLDKGVSLMGARRDGHVRGHALICSPGSSRRTPAFFWSPVQRGAASPPPSTQRSTESTPSRRTL